MMLGATRDGMQNSKNQNMILELNSESSSSSDDEYDKNFDKETADARRSMMRYGRPINPNTMRVSYYIRIIAFAAAMIAIPTELVLRNIVFDGEKDFIINFQKTFSGDFFTVLCNIIIFFGEVLFIEALAVFIYLFADPLLGFKSSLVTFFGVFIIAFIKLIYQIPRPYWKFLEIEGKKCNFDFSGPSDHTFLSTFFYSYIIIIFSKYSEVRRPRLAMTLLILNAVLVILIGFSMNYLGNTFLFEGLIGVIYGAIYCIICISLDSEIHSLWEKTAFIVKSSRKYKFKLFFLWLLLFVIVVIYFNAALVSFKVDHQWILNTIDDCHNDDSYEYRMGLDFTFEDTAVIFSIIGAWFGASTATITIENILWSETVFWKRVLRGFIGSALIVGIFLLVGLIPHEDHPTKYFFSHLLPHLVAAYWAFGLVPIISNKIGLVNKGADLGSVISIKSVKHISEDDDPDGDENKDIVEDITGEEEKTPNER